MSETTQKENDVEKLQLVPLSEITVNEETQIRVAVNEETVQKYYEIYAEDVADHRRLPPIMLMQDEDGKYRIADGNHRVLAAKRLEMKEIEAYVRPGGIKEAIWKALFQNGKHGLPLNSKDLRRAIELALKYSPQCSCKLLSMTVGCSKSYVAKVKNELSTSGQLQPAEKVIGKDGKTYSGQKTAKKSTCDADDIGNLPLRKYSKLPAADLVDNLLPFSPECYAENLMIATLGKMKDRKKKEKFASTAKKLIQHIFQNLEDEDQTQSLGKLIDILFKDNPEIALRVTTNLIEEKGKTIVDKA